MREHIGSIVLLVMLWLLWQSAASIPGAHYAMSGGLIGVAAQEGK